MVLGKAGVTKYVFDVDQVPTFDRALGLEEKDEKVSVGIIEHKMLPYTPIAYFLSCSSRRWEDMGTSYRHYIYNA